MTAILYGIIEWRIGHRSLSFPKSLSELLAWARRRSISHLLLHQLVLAAAVALGGAVVILLAGTELLSWYWILLVAAVSLGAGLFLLRRRIPSSYAVAQRIDARLKLADTISTAAYFEAPSDPLPADPRICESQRRQAEKVAKTVDLGRALPLLRPHALYPACGLLLAACGIFLLRYAVLGTFDPSKSLIKTAYDTFFRSPSQQAKLGNLPRDPTQLGNDPDADGALTKDADFAGDPSTQSDEPADAQVQPNSKADSKDGQGKKDDAASPDNPENSKNPDKSNDGKQSGNQNGKQDPSMMDKVREALSDMLNKMKPQPSESAQNQNQKGDAQSQQQDKQQGQPQDKTPGDNADAQSDNQQSSDGESQGNSNDAKNSQDQQRGIGSEEGDKSARDAAALKAMGKISELLGKRAQNVSGTVMVEVGSTKQQLKTAIEQRQATHSEAGSEIHRDEVPAIYEQFVQQYFEQIRKIPAKPASATAAGKNDQ